jgi:hypothetical protein
MTGYRPEDDWSQITSDSGEPMSGSWRVIVVFAAILALAILVCSLGHFSTGQVVCSLATLAFFWISALSFQRLRIGIRERYFEAGRFGRVYRSEMPVNYWIYFGVHSFMLPIGLAIGVVCAAAVYLNPFGG